MPPVTPACYPLGMATDDSTLSPSGALRLVDVARLEGLEAGRLEGRRSAYLAAEKLVRGELAKRRPDFKAVAVKLKRCAEW